MTNDGTRRRGFVAEVLTLLLLGSFAIGLTVLGGNSGEPASGEPIAEEKAPAEPPRPEPPVVAAAAPDEDDDEEGPKLTTLENIPLDTQRHAYAAQQIAESNAASLADSMYPDKQAPDDTAGKSLFRAARDGRYDELRLAARKTVARRFDLSRGQLDAIRKLGEAEHWSVPEIVAEMPASASATHAMAEPENSSGKRAAGGRRSGGGRSSRR